MYKKTTLTNQLRVITHPMKDRDSLALGFWIGAGGRFEDDRTKGTAHFLEHILFKGSRHYSCEAIKEEIEGVGGALNAFTSEEQTCYFAKIPAKHLVRTFDILSDMVFHPRIAAEDVKKERTVILEEIKMYHDMPQYYVMELLDELMWPNHPLGKNLAGTFASVSNLNSEDLRRFHSDYYSVHNIVISACGRLDHASLAALAQKKTGNILPRKKVDFVKADNTQKSPRVKFFKKDIEQMHLALGMLGLHEDHPDKYALALLNVILGANMSSRLFSEVREKRGLAYSISSSSKSLNDTGLFLIRAGVDNQKAVEALAVILRELEKIKQQGVSADEVRRAKDYLLGQLLLGLEDTLDHMLWIGEALVSLNKVKTRQAVVKLVEKVSLKDVKRVANDVLDRKRFNLALVGPIKEEQEKQLRQIIGL